MLGSVTDTPGESTRSRPSRAWYAAAFVPFLLSLIPAYLLGQAAADEVEVRLAVLASETLEFDGDDRAIYAVTGDASDRVRCSLRSADGDVVLVERSRTHASTEQDGTSWFRVGSIPSDLEDGTYTLRCRDRGEAVDASSLAVSDPTSWGRFALLLIAAFAIPVAAAVFGTLIGAVVLGLRRRADRADDQDPSPLPIQLDE